VLGQETAGKKKERKRTGLLLPSSSYRPPYTLPAILPAML
jgi:hypothetical protein